MDKLVVVIRLGMVEVLLYLCGTSTLPGEKFYSPAQNATYALRGGFAFSDVGFPTEESLNVTFLIKQILIFPQSKFWGPELKVQARVGFDDAPGAWWRSFGFVSTNDTFKRVSARRTFGRERC